MAGTNLAWGSQVRPGAYVDIKTKGSFLNEINKRGVVTIPLNLDWGQSHEIIKVNPETDFKQVFACDLNDTKLIPIREALKGVSNILVYRLNQGEKATATLGDLVCTALHGGSRGNALSFAVSATVGGSGFTVTTMLDNKVVDSQGVAAISELKPNAYVEFSGSGSLTPGASIPLVGGTSADSTVQDYQDYFQKLMLADFNTMAIPVNDEGIKGAAVSFIKQLRDVENKKVQGVIPDYAAADYEGIISVKNGVVLAEGTCLDAAMVTPWVAAVTAGAAINQSNTYRIYEGSVDAYPRYTNSEIIELLQSGNWVFVPGDKGAGVEQDINSFTGFTPERSSILRKNRVLRVLDGVVTDISKMFKNYYIGKVDNNDDGRNLFKSDLLKYLTKLESMGAIKDLVKDRDLSVSQGADSDSIVVDLALMPVDSIEKLYMTIVVS